MSQAEINIITIFRRISDAIDSLTEDEISKLSDPQYQVEVRAVRRRIKDDLATSLNSLDVDDIIKELSIHGTRLDAQSFLDLKCPSKKTLEQIARKLDILIVRQDKAEALRDKIIEATVGARIRSQAIQGTGV